MKVKQLIRILEDHDGDAEVRLAIQPHYPLAEQVTGACSQEEIRRYMIDEEGNEEFDENGAPIDEAENVVWIAATSGGCYDSPYAPRAVWEVCQ